MTTKLIAFHGDAQIKAKYLARVRAHQAADELVHGTYWQGGKGCAVGCTIHGNNHDDYEKQLGIPVALAFLEDRMFETFTNGKAKDWPEQFLTVIPVGADLSGVIPQFMSWLMLDETHGTAFTTTDAELADLAAEVGLRYAAGDTEGDGATDLAARLRDARSARSAWAAWAAWAAWDAWDAWAAWAAWDARDAWAAWDARDARDARDALVNRSADVLLELMASAPVLNAIEKVA
jgi:hypothetical protein